MTNADSPATSLADLTSTHIGDDNFIGTAQLNYKYAIALADARYATATAGVDNALTGDTITGFESFEIATNNGGSDSLLECASGEANCVITDDKIWVRFTEDGSNDSKFTNFSDDIPNLKTTSDAQRGLSFSVEYDNRVTSGVEYSTTNIVIDAGDEWKLWRGDRNHADRHRRQHQLTGCQRSGRFKPRPRHPDHNYWRPTHSHQRRHNRDSRRRHYY